MAANKIIKKVAAPLGSKFMFTITIKGAGRR
jgi:hypothetical protein